MRFRCDFRHTPCRTVGSPPLEVFLSKSSSLHRIQMSENQFQKQWPTAVIRVEPFWSIPHESFRRWIPSSQPIRLKSGTLAPSWRCAPDGLSSIILTLRTHRPQVNVLCAEEATPFPVSRAALQGKVSHSNIVDIPLNCDVGTGCCSVLSAYSGRSHPQGIINLLRKEPIANKGAQRPQVQGTAGKGIEHF